VVRIRVRAHLLRAALRATTTTTCVLLVAHLLLAALLVPLDEHVLLEQVDVVEGLEQVGRLAQQRLVRVRDRVRGGVRGRVRVKVRVGVKVRVRVRASSEEFGLG